MVKKFPLHHIGTILMALSLLPFLVIYYPILSFIINPPNKEIKLVKKDFYIIIPKINVYSKIIENVDPWKKEEYQKALQKGIAHAKGTVMPEGKGTVFLFAHSSDAPWRITQYNTPFLFLGNLDKDDEIEIFKNGKEYKYRVREKKVIWPNETKYLKETKKDQLILQTCWPIGMTFQRLLVFADPKN